MPKPRESRPLGAADLTEGRLAATDRTLTMRYMSATTQRHEAIGPHADVDGLSAERVREIDAEFEQVKRRADERLKTGYFSVLKRRRVSLPTAD